MSTDAVLALLYAVSGIAGCACYAPQLVRLWRSAEARRGMSLAAWGGWLLISLVGVVYAVRIGGRPEMMAVSTLNAGCQALVVTVVAVQRRRDRYLSGPAPRRRRSGSCWLPASGSADRASVPRR